MYTYNKIQEIQNDLRVLISKIKQGKNFVNVLSPEEICHFEEALLQYDAVLDEIGIGGVCTDSELNKGFEVTENFILKINGVL